MATATYDLLDSTTLSSSAASVTFSSINQSYRDLVLIVDSSGFASSNNLLFRVNSDTGSNYSYVVMNGNGSSANSFSGTSTSGRCGFVGTGNFNYILQFQDYSATDKHKPVLARCNDATARVSATANRWANTSAISSVTLITDTSNFPSGTTAYLYGVAS